MSREYYLVIRIVYRKIAHLRRQDIDHVVIEILVRSLDKDRRMGILIPQEQEIEEQLIRAVLQRLRQMRLALHDRDLLLDLRNDIIIILLVFLL